MVCVNSEASILHIIYCWHINYYLIVQFDYNKKNLLILLQNQADEKLESSNPMPIFLCL